MTLRPSATRGALFACAALSAAACHRNESTPSGAPNTTASAAPAQSSAPAPSASAPKPASTTRSAPPTTLPNGCRVLQVKGVKPGAPASPGVGTRLTGFGWFELAAGVELAVKHGDTLREFRLIGPGQFLACPDAEETVLVASGTVTTTAGPGARAGALVTLATPFGVVEYPDADLWLDVGTSKLSLAVKQGQAMLFGSPKPGAAPAPPVSVRAPSGRTELHGGVNTAELSRHCEDLQQQVDAAVPAPSDAKQRAACAVTRMQARRAARLACEVARAASGRLAEPERSRFETQLLGRGTNGLETTRASDAAQSTHEK